MHGQGKIECKNRTGEDHMDPNRIVNIGVEVLPLTDDALPQVDRAI